MSQLNKYAILTLSWVICLTACRKLITVDPPPDQLVTASVFKDTANAKSAVLGIYATMAGGPNSFLFANGAITSLAGLAADELSPGSGNPTDVEFSTNNISPENQKIADQLWKSAYKIIYQTNACLEGLSSSETLKAPIANEAVRNQLMGECYFVRAFIYFNLVNLFDGVPLVLSTDYRLNAILPRDSKNNIYQQIETDLALAIDLLSNAYASPGKLRPNRIAAKALLARVCLYRNKLVQAENLATEIIDLGGYMLEDNLNNVFLSTSKESIWQLRPYFTGYETTEGQLFNPTSSATSIPAYLVTENLLNSFVTSDKRRLNNNWIKSKTIGPRTYYYPFKYKLRMDNNTTPLENYILFRLAEQYLIRAESRCLQNNLNAALADLNKVRQRAGLPDASYTTMEDIHAAIMTERRFELFAEWGHRWYDLKRTSLANTVMPAIKGASWESTDLLFPIPEDELNRNPQLIQNPGY